MLGSSLYQKVLGHPFVYDRIRPWFVGGINMQPSYRNLAAGPGDVILDVGCGTGDALRYLSGFASYHGFDTDPLAIATARKRAEALGLPGARFQARAMTADDVAAIAPTRVILSGLLHHLSDDEVVTLLGTLAGAQSVKRIATQDVVFLPGELINNLLAGMDRGRYARSVDGYQALVARSGLQVVASDVLPCGGRRSRMKFLFLALEPRP